jgi:hypothetical protein
MSALKGPWSRTIVLNICTAVQCRGIGPRSFRDQAPGLVPPGLLGALGTWDNDFVVTCVRLLRRREIVLFLRAIGRIFVTDIVLVLNDSRLNVGFSSRRELEERMMEHKINHSLPL